MKCRVCLRKLVILNGEQKKSNNAVERSPGSGRGDTLKCRSGTGIRKALAKLVTLKGSGSLSPSVYVLNDGCLEIDSKCVNQFLVST